MPEPISREVVWLRITPQAPLLIGNESGIGNYQQSADHIPGSVLRGAVAMKLLKQSQAAFDALFAGAEPYFGNAYLGGVGPVWPLPLTARTCKRYPGLSSGTRDDDKEHHGVVDVLAADFAYDLAGDLEFDERDRLLPSVPVRTAHDLPPARDQLDICPVCRRQQQAQPMMPAGGYYAWDGQAPLPAGRAPTTRTTHVGINRARAVAQDQLLFTQERLAAHETSDAFFARVVVPSAKAGSFAEAVTGTYFIGRGRSRGNGRVSIEPEPVAPLPALSTRLEDFQLGLAVALTPYGQKYAGNLTGTLFSVTLRAPAILHTAGRPLRVPSAAMLGLPAADRITCVRAWARTAVTGGWDSAARLPRRKALAVTAGSVYLFWAEADVDREKLASELAAAELNGLGAERERGYGQYTVCAPFHYSDWARR